MEVMCMKDSCMEVLTEDFGDVHPRLESRYDTSRQSQQFNSVSVAIKLNLLYKT